MDYREWIDNFLHIACIISVEQGEGDNDLTYKIIAANDGYKRSVVASPELFEDHVPYTRYIKRDLNFELMVRKCVESKTPLHSYVDAAYYNAWMSIFMIPLKSEDDKKLCLFSYELSPKADTDKLSDISANAAAHVLRTCIRLRETDDFQEAMEHVIADIRTLCSASRCCILLTDFEKETCQVLCESIGEEDEDDRPLQFYIDQGDFFDIVKTWGDLIDGSNCFIISGEEDLHHVERVAPKWAESLKQAKIKTLVIYPLRSGHKTIGYIWAKAFDAENTMQITETLEITTFILSSEIANDQMVRQMKIMSSTDLLTGVLNRNAMNNRILDNDSGASPIEKEYGLFFVDVNGLKSMNDSKGHIAGDGLLKDMALTLQEFFPGKEVYRIGGDEFLVIATNITREQFDEYNRVLRANTERKNRAHYAFGSSYSEDIPDIRKAMQHADKAMYDDKELYYKRHPEYEWDRRTARKG